MTPWPGRLVSGGTGLHTVTWDGGARHNLVVSACYAVVNEATSASNRVIKYLVGETFETMRIPEQDF